MMKVSGRYTGKVNWQTNVSLPHLANHQLALVEVSGKHKSSDSKWNGAVMTYWSSSDVTEDKGIYHAYFILTDKDGDTHWGTSEGKPFTSGGQVKVEGTIKYDGGNGKFKGMKGQGTLKGHMISPIEVTFDWEVEYEI